MTDISIRADTTWGNVDRSYLGSSRGITDNRTATLDGSLFLVADFPADGTGKAVIPAGTVVALVASGLYAPYDDDAVDVLARVAAGIIYNPAEFAVAGAGRAVCALQTIGDVLRDRLPYAGATVGRPGRLDAAAEADLKQFTFRNRND